jgi:hypothetical protein
MEAVTSDKNQLKESSRTTPFLFSYENEILDSLARKAAHRLPMHEPEHGTLPNELIFFAESTNDKWHTCPEQNTYLITRLGP